MDYNTQRTHLKLREYGRNVQNLVEHLKTIEDTENRNLKAGMLVELMKSINPDINKDSSDYDQKVWDDLYIISNFELDFKGPFEKPNAEILDKKPQRLEYSANQIKFKHYGRSVEILIEQAIAMEDPKEKEGAVVAIGRLMKSFFQTWNNDTIEDEQVLKNIKQLSKDQLDINLETVKELGLFDSDKKPPTRSFRSNNNNNKGGGRRNNQGGKGRRNSVGKGGGQGGGQNRRRHHN
ncbi:MAG: DUF4290 domain-containing protein [Cyclobacteriaceae bacterium]